MKYACPWCSAENEAAEINPSTELYCTVCKRDFFPQHINPRDSVPLKFVGPRITNGRFSSGLHVALRVSPILVALIYCMSYSQAFDYVMQVYEVPPSMIPNDSPLRILVAVGIVLCAILWVLMDFYNATVKKLQA